MNPRLRSAILATTALAGAVLAASSLQARDAAGGQPSGADRWRLRPADVATTGSTVPSAPDRPSTKERPAFEIPQERRAVRVVYPGLLADR